MLAERSQQRSRSVAVAVTGGARGCLRIAARPLGPAGIARAIENLVELGFEHGLQEFAGSIPKACFNRIEPVVENVSRRLNF